MTNNSAQQLASIFNLSDYEARLYFAALNEAEMTITALAEYAGMPRTAVYPPLKQLVAKGFITALPSKGKRTLYHATEPKYLENIFERRRIDLRDIVEHFSSSITSGSGEVWVRYFEGRAAVDTALEIFLREATSKIWKTFENPAHTERLIGSRQFENYLERRVAKGIRARVIIPAREHTPWIKEILANKERWLLDVRIVSPDTYPIEATIAIGGAWILAESLQQKPFAILVKNEPLARTIESIHDMVWDRYTS